PWPAPSYRGAGLVGLADGLGGADPAEEQGQDDQGDDVGQALDEGVVDPGDPQEHGEGVGPGEQQAGGGGADRGPVAEDEGGQSDEAAALVHALAVEADQLDGQVAAGQAGEAPGEHPPR